VLRCPLPKFQTSPPAIILPWQDKVSYRHSYVLYLSEIPISLSVDGKAIVYMYIYVIYRSSMDHPPPIRASAVEIGVDNDLDECLWAVFRGIYLTMGPIVAENTGSLNLITPPLVSRLTKWGALAVASILHSTLAIARVGGVLYTRRYMYA
jgi:hypothetical protein